VAKLNSVSLDALVDLVRRTLNNKHVFERQIEERHARRQSANPHHAVRVPEKESQRSGKVAQFRAATLAPVESHIEEHASTTVPTIRVASAMGCRVLGLFPGSGIDASRRASDGRNSCAPASLTASLRLAIGRGAPPPFRPS